MATLSGVQVAKLARDAGLRGESLVKAVAIAKGESRWNSNAVGDVSLKNRTWGPSVGLWQIRSLNVQRGTGGARDETRLKDPKFNAKSMAIISNVGTNFRPWTVYTKGIYRQHMGEARQAVAALNGGGGSVDMPATTGSSTVETISDDGPGIDVKPEGWREWLDFFGNPGGWAANKGQEEGEELSEFGAEGLKLIGWGALGVVGIIIGLVLIFKDVGAEVTGSIIKEALGA